jgi:hypothetical protein
MEESRCALALSLTMEIYIGAGSPCSSSRVLVPHCKLFSTRRATKKDLIG